MYDRARQSHFNAVNMHSCPLRITNVRGWWIFSLSIFFAVHLFWKKKSEAIMRINQVFLYSKSFCSSLILLWMRAHTHTCTNTHKQKGKIVCFLFFSKNKPQVLFAKLLSINCPSALMKHWDHCSGKCLQVGSACPMQDAAAAGSGQMSTGPGRKHLPAVGR